MSNEILVIIAIVVIFFVITWILLIQRKKIKRWQKDLIYFKSTYLWKIGVDLQYPNGYKLISMDGGVNWYACEYKSKESGLIIIGPAEEVFPGLIQRLKAFDALISYVEKNGPITLTGNNRQADDIKILKDAGFEVM